MFNIVQQLVNELKTMPFTLLIVLSLVLYSFYGHYNYANAADIQQLSTKVDKNSEAVEKVLQLQLSEALRNLQLQRCITADDQAERTLSNTIEDLQEDYRRLTGSRYPLRECSA